MTEFLSHFDKSDHGFITQLFREAYLQDFHGIKRGTRREPSKNLTEMLENLEHDLEQRSKVGTDNGMRESILESDLLSERKAFARMIARQEQERHTTLDKNKVAQPDSRKGAMEKKPVSEGQLKFLKNLGFTGTVANCWEASRKIDELQRA